MGIINDGFSTKITFSQGGSGVSGVVLYEKSVQPPGIEMGGANDTTTMRNTAWRTKQPKALKTLTDSGFKAAYDPAVYDDILDLIGVNQLIEVEFSNGHTISFWGWLDSFLPDEIQEGLQPVASCKIVCSNQDGDGVEVAPVYA